jgi:hypothetical protein
VSGSMQEIGLAIGSSHPRRCPRWAFLSQSQPAAFGRSVLERFSYFRLHWLCNSFGSWRSTWSDTLSTRSRSRTCHHGAVCDRDCRFCNCVSVVYAESSPWNRAPNSAVEEPTSARQLQSLFLRSPSGPKPLSSKRWADGEELFERDVTLHIMTKVAITGRFATTTDVLRVHRISPIRQAWLEEQLTEIERGRGSASKKVGGAKTAPTASGTASHSSTSSRNGRRSAARAERSTTSKSRPSSKRVSEPKRSTSAKKR